MLCLGWDFGVGVGPVQGPCLDAESASSSDVAVAVADSSMFAPELGLELAARVTCLHLQPRPRLQITDRNRRSSHSSHPRFRSHRPGRYRRRYYRR